MPRGSVNTTPNASNAGGGGGGGQQQQRGGHQRRQQQQQRQKRQRRMSGAALEGLPPPPPYPRAPRQLLTSAGTVAYVDPYGWMQEEENPRVMSSLTRENEIVDAFFTRAEAAQSGDSTAAAAAATTAAAATAGGARNAAAAASRAAPFANNPSGNNTSAAIQKKPWSRASLFREMKARQLEEGVSLPIADRGYWYYTRTVPHAEYALHCRRPYDPVAGVNADFLHEAAELMMAASKAAAAAAASAGSDTGGVSVAATAGETSQNAVAEHNRGARGNSAGDASDDAGDYEDVSSGEEGEEETVTTNGNSNNNNNNNNNNNSAREKAAAASTVPTAASSSLPMYDDEEVFLDVNLLKDELKLDFVDVGEVDVSPDGTRVAVTIDCSGGNEIFTVFILECKDVNFARWLQEDASEAERAWAQSQVAQQLSPYTPYTPSSPVSGGGGGSGGGAGAGKMAKKAKKSTFGSPTSVSSSSVHAMAAAAAAASASSRRSNGSSSNNKKNNKAPRRRPRPSHTILHRLDIFDVSSGVMWLSDDAIAYLALDDRARPHQLIHHDLRLQATRGADAATAVCFEESDESFWLDEPLWTSDKQFLVCSSASELTETYVVPVWGNRRTASAAAATGKPDASQNGSSGEGAPAAAPATMAEARAAWRRRQTSRADLAAGSDGARRLLNDAPALGSIPFLADKCRAEWEEQQQEEREGRQQPEEAEAEEELRRVAAAGAECGARCFASFRDFKTKPRNGGRPIECWVDHHSELLGPREGGWIINSNAHGCENFAIFYLPDSFTDEQFDRMGGGGGGGGDEEGAGGGRSGGDGYGGGAADAAGYDYGAYGGEGSLDAYHDGIIRSSELDYYGGAGGLYGGYGAAPAGGAGTGGPDNGPLPPVGGAAGAAAAGGATLCRIGGGGGTGDEMGGGGGGDERDETAWAPLFRYDPDVVIEDVECYRDFIVLLARRSGAPTALVCMVQQVWEAAAALALPLPLSALLDVSELITEHRQKEQQQPQQYEGTDGVSQRAPRTMQGHLMFPECRTQPLPFMIEAVSFTDAFHADSILIDVTHALFPKRTYELCPARRELRLLREEVVLSGEHFDPFNYDGCLLWVPSEFAFGGGDHVGSVAVAVGADEGGAQTSDATVAAGSGGGEAAGEDSEFSTDVSDDEGTDQLTAAPTAHSSNSSGGSFTKVPTKDPAAPVAIPVIVVWRRDTFARGRNVAMVDVYGSYGDCADPPFSASQLSLLDRGVVCAYACVRGGGELGIPWRDAGRKLQRATAVNDFMSVAAYLPAAGVCLRGGCGGGAAGVVALGGSAGGMVVCRAMLQAPRLFRGVAGMVPFVDCLCTLLQEDLPLTVSDWEEYGNPLDDPEAFRFIRALSPVENVAACVSPDGPFPHVYLETAYDDTRVGYWEAMKLTALLRDNVTPRAAVLHYCSLSGGHTGASGRHDALHELAREYAFILFCAGL